MNMTIIKKAGFAAMLTLGLSGLVLAQPADFDAKMEARPQADRDRDAARKPVETIEALGVQEGWTVIDVAAGGGYFTRVLSAAVGPNGKVLMQVGARALETNDGKAQKDMAAELGNVEPVFGDMSSIPAGSADAAITAQNYHDAYNFRGEEGSQAFLKDIYNALKPGGVAVIIDHEGNEGAANGDLHRIPAATARAQIEKAGFEVVSESDILNNADDDHTLGVREASVRGETDQFLFVVRKPS
jgi:predicted methyltransferase